MMITLLQFSSHLLAEGKVHVLMVGGIILASVVLVVGIIALVVFLDKHFAKKRTEAMKPVAESLGMEFSAESDNELLATMQVFKHFNRGHSRKMRNVMKAETETARLAIFDYRYTTGHGKNQSVHKQMMFAMQTSELDTTPFLLRPETLLDKAGALLGGQDIDFVEYPEFSKLFVLQGDDESAVREFFDKDLVAFFEQNSQLYVESAPGVFIFFSSLFTKPEQIRDLMDQGYATYAAISDRLTR